ncbi:MAG: metal-dependent hydrolase [Halolamina sp.]
MSPLGHLGIVVWLVHWREYTGRAAWLCLLGAFLPDIVDKPLGVLGVVPSLHTVGHSVFVAVVVVAVAAAGRRWRPVAVGWLSHLALDLPLAIPAYLNQYVWPLRTPAGGPDEPLSVYVLSYATSPAFAVELAVVVGAVVLLARGEPRFGVRS